MDGAIEAKVAHVQHCLQVLQQGAQHRTVGATAINKESSRSHSVFTVSLDVEEKDAQGLKPQNSQLS